MSRKKTKSETIDQLKRQRDQLIAVIKGAPEGTAYDLDSRDSYDACYEGSRMRHTASLNMEQMRLYYADLLPRKLEWRAIRNRPCDACTGSGQRMYSSTATWKRGIGGAAMTHDVCDKCWGSGDSTHKWVDLRALFSELQSLRRGAEASK